MVRPKTSSKKPQKRGVDFKKYKRKLGRKLPPAKNATNTEIKSKAIILPEQSVASEREGLALSKKGLTLKELLQQTSHHNGKVRRDALIGIKELASRNPSELKLHKLVMIEKLRERINDDDKFVRETLYQLFKTVVFPGCKEDIPGPIISLLMAYIFNAMTHLVFDIRLMAFKFFELVVQNYPSSFLLYAEKILQNYEDILKKSQNYLQDKGKLKNTLAGLVRCLSQFPSVQGIPHPSSEKNTDDRGTLHAFDAEVPRHHTDVSSIIYKLEDLMPVLINCFQELAPTVLAKGPVNPQSFECIICVLQSIDLALKYFIYGSKCQTESETLASIYKAPDVTVWGETILPNLFKKLLDVFPLGSIHNQTEKNGDKYYILNVAIAEIILNYNEWIDTPIPMEKVLEYLENALCGEICSNTGPSKAVREKHIVSLLPFIPKILLRAESSSKYRDLLQAFTEAFKNCKPESSLKLACLAAIEEMLLPSNRYNTHLLNTSNPEIQPFQIAWIQELPVLLVQLGDRHPSSSKIVLHLHLRLGQHVLVGSLLALEFDNTQNSFLQFYCTLQEESNGQGGLHYGPFIKLSRDCQELAICSLYYISSLGPQLLKSLTYCCLYQSMDSFVIFRIIEVLQSSYKAGHIQTADQISFLATLLARFRTYPGQDGGVMENNEKKSNHITLKAITSAICPCLYQMGDNALVLQMLQKILLHEMSLNPPLDNMCAMLRTLVSLDFRPGLLSKESFVSLGNSLLRYMVDSAYCIPENDLEPTDQDQMRMCKYYLVPCFILFDKSDNLLKLVLNLMGSLITESRTPVASPQCDMYSADRLNKLNVVASILLFIHKDVKMQRRLSCSKAEISYILQEVILFQSSNDNNLTLEERHRIQIVFDKLKEVTGRLHCWNTDDVQKMMRSPPII